MQNFHQCGNCGWSGREQEFTWNWCDECAKAALKGFVSAVAAGVGALLVALVFGR